MNERPDVVDRESWLAARRRLLDEEKAATRQLDRLASRRRELPWVRVDEEYVFDTPAGKRTLADLFDRRHQLIVYHFMMGPDLDEGCPSCSFWADGYDGLGVHLAHRDTTLVAVSRAPLARIEAYRRRMGWNFTWVSSAGSTFSVDHHVSFPDGGESTYNFQPFTAEAGTELPGLSVFFRDDDGTVYHTYSAYGRGLDIFNSAYQLLDMTPKGRDEDDLPWTMAWLRRHDAYDD